MDRLITSGVSDSYLLTDLKKLDRWLCWQTHTQDDGYEEKRPVNLNQETGEWYRVSYRDSGNWYEYKEARRLYEEHRDEPDGVDGLQVVIKHRDDDFIVVDLDDCVEDGQPADWALDYVKEAGTYAEISPSGAGVHLIFRGSVDRQGWAGSEDEFDGEVYKRYIVTVTGDHIVGTPYRAKQNQEFLDDLFDENDIWWRNQLYETQDDNETYGAPSVDD